MKKTAVALISSAIVLVIVILIALSVDVIPTGATGIMIHYGQVNEIGLESGKLAWHNLFSDKVAFVNNKQQDIYIKDTVWGETNDATPVYAQGITVTYQIPPEKSVWIYLNVTDYEKNIISSSMIVSATKTALVELSPKESTNRAKIEPLVMKKLQESADEKYGEGVVLIKKVTIDQMDFEEAYNAAIQAKSIAAQEAEQQEIANKVAIEKEKTQNEIAQLQAEQKKRDAEAEAAITKIQSEAEAQRIITLAEAEAEANKKIAESLTTNLVELKKIERWNGELSQINGGASTVLTMDID